MSAYGCFQTQNVARGWPRHAYEPTKWLRHRHAAHSPSGTGYSEGRFPSTQKCSHTDRGLVCERRLVYYLKPLCAPAFSTGDEEGKCVFNDADHMGILKKKKYDNAACGDGASDCDVRGE